MDNIDPDLLRRSFDEKIEEKKMHLPNRYLFCCLFFPLFLCAEKGYCQLIDSAALSVAPIYTTLEDALKNPDTVYRLDLKRSKLKTLPKEIFLLKNLQELNLSKNQLIELPEEIGELINLQLLDISSNDLQSLPASIGKLKKLKKISAGRNEIIAIPAQIGELENLEILDLWDNNLSEFPDEMGKLKKLRWMDLRAILIEDDVQERIQKMLPKTKIHFSPSCNCVKG